jgi:subtilisin family serine protease
MDQPRGQTAPAGSGERQILVMLRVPEAHFRPDASYIGNYHSRAQRRVAQQLSDEHDLKLVADWPMPALRVDCFVMELQSDDSAVRMVEELSRDARVESVQTMNQFHLLGHNDPLFEMQPSAKLWQLAKVHELVTGKNVLVAEIDSGVELDHPDLRGRASLARNFVDNSPYAAETHGTAVAGIIAARADDGIGIAGVAPQASLLALRACWQRPGNDGAAFCNSFTLAKALQFALDQNARVINLSLGGPHDRLLERLIDAALARGITIVGAADPHVANGGFPASHPGVLAVTDDEVRDAYTDFFLAPGRDIPTTIPGGRWSFVAGSSFAAAHVTGLVALLREKNPAIQPWQIRDALAGAEVPASAAARPLMIDAWAAIARATAAGAGHVARAATLLPPE